MLVVELSSDANQPEPHSLSQLAAELDVNLGSFTDWACRVEENLRQHISELERLVSDQFKQIKTLKQDKLDLGLKVQEKESAIKDGEARLREAKIANSELSEQISQGEICQRLQKSKMDELEVEHAALGERLREAQSASDKDLAAKEQQASPIRLAMRYAAVRPSGLAPCCTSQVATPAHPAGTARHSRPPRRLAVISCCYTDRRQVRTGHGKRAGLSRRDCTGPRNDPRLIRPRQRCQSLDAAT